MTNTGTPRPVQAAIPGVAASAARRR